MNRITTKLPDVGLVGICMLSAIALLVAFGVSRVAGASATPAAMPETGRAQAASGSGAATGGSAMALPYQQDTTPGDSEWDRGSAIRYHNGEKYAGMSMAQMMGMGYVPGCWRPSARAKAPTYNSRDDRAGKADLQALLTKVLSKYTGPAGLATALADGWYPYPVPASKAWHLVRQFCAGDMNPKDPGGTQLNVRNIESFVLIYTDSGWQVRTGMFMLGDEGDKAPPVGKDGHAPLGAYDYIEIDKPAHLPVWRDPIHKGLVCQLEWHGHDGAEGAATSFDPKHPSTSPWMSHINLYASQGDPFGQAQDADGAEPHAYWTPLHYVPDACNPQGPCE